jgi:monooxygenase
MRAARHLLGPTFEVERHLSPRYDAWDQRLCIAPDGDLFQMLRAGKADIVTDTIESFTSSGIRLACGDELPADIIVTATGLRLKLLGGAALTVDGKPVDPARALVYRGMMYSGVPDMAVASGYTNASWTLKCELVARHSCRLVRPARRVAASALKHGRARRSALSSSAGIAHSGSGICMSR